MFARLGRFCHRRRWSVLAGWALLVLGGAAASGPVFAGLTTRGASGHFESVQGSDVRAGNTAFGPRLVGLVDDVRVADPMVRTAVVAASADLARLPNVVRAVDPYAGARAGLIATDGRAGLVVVDLAPNLSTADRDRAVQAATRRLRRLAGEMPGGATIGVGGQALLDRAINAQVQRDTGRAEIVSLPLTLVVMVVVFGGLLAAALPVIGAIAAIGGAFVCLLGFARFVALDPDTVPVLTLLGLGISIDYALLIVNRFREERAAGCDVAQALERTTATAGRTITFSALTVAACLAALFLFDNPTFRGIGAAGVAVVVVALLAGLTLTPALLAVVGRRIRPDRGILGRDLTRQRGDAGTGRPGTDRGAFARLAGVVQRRPLPIAVGVAALLLAAGLPLLSIRLENGGIGVLPDSAEIVRVQQNIDARFPVGRSDPVTVVARASPAQLRGYLADLGGSLPTGVVAAVGRPERLGSSAYSTVDITPTGGSAGPAARRLVQVLRAHRPAFRTWVTGTAAFLLDFTRSIGRSLPWAFGLVAVAALVLLFVMTGSIVVPVKALLMNTVSLGATFGALVWGFQQGHLAGLLGFTSPGAIETWVPVLVFAFSFGLSMDYEVFLLARIKEVYDTGRRSDEAVRIGLQRTGAIITSAALLIVIVFCGFAAGRMLGIKELGFALSVAIVVDATLVRCLLVPATMTVLGELNWWAPGPLRRLHDRIGLREGGAGPPRPPAPRGEPPPNWPPRGGEPTPNGSTGQVPDGQCRNERAAGEQGRASSVRADRDHRQG